MHPSPTPTIIDELMGDLVFETFTPRCAHCAMIKACMDMLYLK